MSRLSDDRVYEARSLEAVSALPRYHDWVMRGLGPYLKGRVVELGAGIGTISERYARRVDAALLVEPAVNLHARLAEKFRGSTTIATVNATLEEAIAQGVAKPRGYDVALSANVLEHIDDDVAVVKALASLVAPGGRVLTFVPAMPALFGAFDAALGHVRRYTKASLRALMEGQGLEVERLEYFDVVGTLPWLVSGRVLRQASLSPKGAALYDRFAVPVAELVDRVVPKPFGKNLLCVARVR